MPYETDTEVEVVEEKTDTGGLDKVRQQIQQELANRDKSLETLNETVAGLAERIEALSTSSNPATNDDDDDVLDGIGESDLIEGKQLTKALKAIEKKIQSMGAAKLPEADAKLLTDLKQQEEGRKAWASFNSAFGRKFPDLVGRLDEFVDDAIGEIESDPDMDNSDIKGIVWASAKAAGNGKPQPKPRKSTEGTQVTRQKGSTAGTTRSEGDGVARDSNGLPIALWPGESE
jgi:hypothetical protein